MVFTPALIAAVALSFWAPGHEAQVCPHGVVVRDVPGLVGDEITLDKGQTLDGIAAFAPIERGACTFAINRAVWDRLTPEMQCATAVHELGHSVMGYHHSQAGIMAPVFNGITFCLFRLDDVRKERARWRRALRRVHFSWGGKPRWGWRTVR